MKIYAALACAGLAAAMLAPIPASAAKGGCLKYGAAGAVAGHYSGHHGVLGAVTGCAIGAWRRHEARKYDRYQNRRGYRDQTGTINRQPIGNQPSRY
jgi:hypothetical protein